MGFIKTDQASRNPISSRSANMPPLIKRPLTPRYIWERYRGAPWWNHSNLIVSPTNAIHGNLEAPSESPVTMHHEANMCIRVRCRLQSMQLMGFSSSAHETRSTTLEPRDHGFSRTFSSVCEHEASPSTWARLSWLTEEKLFFSKEKTCFCFLIFFFLISFFQYISGQYNLRFWPTKTCFQMLDLLI